MEFSNVLMGIAVIAVALAVFNLGAVVLTKAESTAFATSDPGNVSLVAAASISINFTTDTISWGIGAVDSSASPQSAVLNSEGVITRASATQNWTQETSGLVLKNDGNVHVNLTLISDKTAATFIGGTSVTPRYQWKLSNAVGTACAIGALVVLNPTAYTDVTTGAVARNVCSNFTIGNSLEVDVEIEIPLNSPPEPKSSIVTAQAYYPSI